MSYDVQEHTREYKSVLITWEHVPISVDHTYDLQKKYQRTYINSRNMGTLPNQYYQSYDLQDSRNMRTRPNQYYQSYDLQDSHNMRKRPNQYYQSYDLQDSRNMRTRPNQYYQFYDLQKHTR